MRQLVAALEGVTEQRILLRVFPLHQDVSQHHLVGPLRADSLMDSPGELYAKYGLSLLEGVTVLGQVANRPLPDLDGASEDAPSSSPGQGDDSGDIDAMIDTFIDLYPKLSGTARWPFVTISPIAVYRSTWVTDERG